MLYNNLFLVHALCLLTTLELLSLDESGTLGPVTAKNNLKLLSVRLRQMQ